MQVSRVYCSVISVSIQTCKMWSFLIYKLILTSLLNQAHATWNTNECCPLVWEKVYKQYLPNDAVQVGMSSSGYPFYVAVGFWGAARGDHVIGRYDKGMDTWYMSYQGKEYSTKNSVFITLRNPNQCQLEYGRGYDGVNTFNNRREYVRDPKSGDYVGKSDSTLGGEWLGKYSSGMNEFWYSFDGYEHKTQDFKLLYVDCEASITSIVLQTEIFKIDVQSNANSDLALNGEDYVFNSDLLINDSGAEVDRTVSFTEMEGTVVSLTKSESWTNKFHVKLSSSAEVNVPFLAELKISSEIQYGFDKMSRTDNTVTTENRKTVSFEQIVKVPKYSHVKVIVHGKKLKDIKIPYVAYAKVISDFPLAQERQILRKRGFKGNIFVNNEGTMNTLELKGFLTASGGYNFKIIIEDVPRS